MKIAVMGRYCSLAALAVASNISLAVSAEAQDDTSLLRDGLFARDHNVSVADRPKPEYQAVPVRVGSFVLNPSIAAGLEYNDNIYATNTNATSDGILHIEPQLSATSDWVRNQISAFARANGSYYFDHSSENTTDWALGGSGRLDAAHDLGFSGGASYERDTEPRTSEASPEESKHPIRYDYAEGYIQGTKEFDRVRITARGSVDDYSYDNGVTTAGAELYEEDRDHTDVVGAVKAEYAYSPEMSFFLNVVGNTRDYRNALPTEVLRNSSGYEVTVGSSFDLTHLARGEFYLGYLEQDYDNKPFKDVGGLAIRGKVEYFPTQLTTVTLSGSRSVQDSGIFNVGGFLANAVALQVDHELLRNVILTALVTYTEDDYSVASNYDRTDRISSEQAGLVYLLNRAVSLNLTYVHLNQDSSGLQAGPKFDINRVLGTLSYRF